MTHETIDTARRLLACTTLWCVSACSGAPEDAAGRGGERTLDTRLVVIGVDGADWKVIDALSAEGRLPNLTRLRRAGVSGPLRTLDDIPLSPAIWTSVATGKRPAKHGVTWFLVDQADGTRVPVRSHNRRAKALWNITAEHGLAPTTIGWWATYPAEDVGEGVVVSDALGVHGFGATAREGDDGRKTHPASLYARVDALVPPEHQLPFDFVRRFLAIDEAAWRAERFDPARASRPDPENPVHLFQQYAVTAQGYTAIAEELLAERDAELSLVYYEQVDSFSHLFMKYAPPRLPWVDDEGFARYRDTVHEWYAYQDELLGRLLEHVDLSTTAVLVVSDHGFKSGARRIKSTEVVDVARAHLDHETDGILIAAGPHLLAGATVDGASVLDVAPTVLHYLGLPVGKDMDGRVLTELFTPEFVAANPTRYVSTHEDGAAPAVAPTEDYDASDNLDALRALGYAGEDEGPAPDEESSPEIHNGLGRVLLREGQLERALEEFERALALDPNNAEALLNIGAIHQAWGRTQQAEHFAERALQADPSSTGALAQLGSIRRDQGDLGEALRLHRLALAIDDSQPALYLGLGDVLHRAGRFEEAEAAFREVLALDPDSFQARYNLGVTLAAAGRVDEAIASLEEALAAAPTHPDAPLAHNNLGAILLDRDELDAALEHFEAAVAASGTHVESRYNAALIHLERGRLDEATALLSEAAELQPNHHAVNLRLGLAHLAALRDEEAYRCLLLVRRLYPEDWAATVGLAVVHARAGDAGTALTLADEALAAGGEDARALASSYPLLVELLEAR